MKMKKILVLMSTYNGELFVEEQINSILNQEGVEVELLIRDDGSIDNTVAIIEKCASKHNNVSFFCGKNVGPAKSFIDLIVCAKDADYYAFADQDDVWDKNKLRIAVCELEKLNGDLPTLYFSNLRIVDENLVFYRCAHNKSRQTNNKYSSLVETLATGCTEVFNGVAQQIVAQNPPENCTMHDTWIYMVCKLLGETIYDFEPHISYRQHAKNVVGAGLKKKSIGLIISKVKKSFNREFQPRLNNAVEFYKCYGNQADEQLINKIRKVIDYKKSIKHKISLFADRDIRATSVLRDVQYRILMVLEIM